MKKNRRYLYLKVTIVCLLLIIGFRNFQLRQTIVENNGREQNIELDLLAIPINCHYQAKGAWDFYLSGCQEYQIGEKYLIHGTVVGVTDNQVQYRKNFDVKEISLFEPSVNSGKFIFRDFFIFSSLGIQTVRSKLIFSLQQQLSPRASNLLLPLIFGNQVFPLVEPLKATITSLGLSHLFAVSGFHLNVIFCLLLFFCLDLPKNWRFLCLSSLLLGYTLLVGTPLSVMRAGLMAIFNLIGRTFFGKQTQPIFILFLVFILMSLPWMLNLYDVGFQLSFLSTLGILLFIPLFQDGETFFFQEKLFGFFSHSKKQRCIGLKILFLIKSTFFATLAATLATLPLQLNYFGTYSLVSIPANLVFAPVVSFLINFGAAFLALINLLPDIAIIDLIIARPFAWGLNVFAASTEQVLFWASRNLGWVWAFKGSFSPLSIVIYYYLGWLLVRRRQRRLTKPNVYLAT